VTRAQTIDPAVAAGVGELFWEKTRELDRARAEAEGRLTEHAEALGAEMEAKLSKRQRRQELKLVRQERDRKLHEAERQVEERSKHALEAISAQAEAIEERLREARIEAERGRAAIVDTAAMLQERIQRLLDAEARFTALLEQIAASEQRVQAANQRVVLAERRVLDLEHAVAS
jgi:chromosome segregation ATPase